MEQPTQAPPQATKIQAKEVWLHLTSVQKTQVHQSLIRACQTLTQKLVKERPKNE